MKKNIWYLLPLFVFILLGGLLFRGLSLNPHWLPSVKLGKRIPDFQLPSLTSQQLFSPLQWKGKTVLLNVWASWCSACTEEQQVLLDLAQKGIKIYGLNYKDDSQQALNWLETWGNPYQAVGLDEGGRVGIDLGVYGTPETFLIDSAGMIQYRHTGPLTMTIWEKEFLPRMLSLERGVST